MAGYHLFGINSLGARFINAAAALATVLLFYGATSLHLGNRVAFNSSLVLGSSLIFIFLARVAMPDMLLTLFLLSSILSSWYGIERFLTGRNGAPLFWLGCCFLALAMLTAGTFITVVPLVTGICYLITIGKPTLIFNRRWILLTVLPAYVIPSLTA